MSDLAIGVTAERLLIADGGQIEYSRDETVRMQEAVAAAIPGADLVRLVSAEALRLNDGGRIALGIGLRISDTVTAVMQTGPTRFVPAETLRLSDTVAAALTVLAQLVPAEALRLSDAVSVAPLQPLARLVSAEALRISDVLAVALVPTVGGMTWGVEMQFSPGVWTAVTHDVATAEAFRWQRGSTANGPTDRMADPGLFEFSLRNDAGNSGGLLGYYSLGHTNCRAGFTYGIPVRLRATWAGTIYDLFRGRLKTIDPDPGLLFNRRTHCTVQDPVADLVDAHVIGIAPQVNQTEDQLLTAVLANVAAMPPAVAFDPGLDVTPYAFDTLGSGASAWAAMTDVVVSALGWCYGTGDGTLVYENRHVRTLKMSAHTFNGDTDGVVLRVPNSLDRVYNRVRIAYHPKVIDPAPTTVLFAAPTRTAVAPGQTVVIWGSYRDDTNTLKLIGGIAIQDGTLTVADYSATSVEDGTGSDLAASVTVFATGFGASAKFEIGNTGLSTAYVLVQIRGEGVYDNGPITVESYAVEAYGDRPIDIDLPFQSSGAVAQDMADYIRSSYALHRVLDAFAIPASRSTALLTQALALDIGDVITLSETVTGTTAIPAAIHGLEGVVSDTALTMTWALVPQSISPVLIFDDAVWGVFDSSNAILGWG